MGPCWPGITSKIIALISSLFLRSFHQRAPDITLLYSHLFSFRPQTQFPYNEHPFLLPSLCFLVICFPVTYSHKELATLNWTSHKCNCIIRIAMISLLYPCYSIQRSQDGGVMLILPDAVTIVSVTISLLNSNRMNDSFTGGRESQSWNSFAELYISNTLDTKARKRNHTFRAKNYPHNINTL